VLIGEVAISEHRPPVRRRHVRLALAAFVCVVGLAPLIVVGLAVGGSGSIRYVVDGNRLSIETGDFLNPARSVALDNITAVETVQLRRGRRVFGTGFPGHCVGRFAYEGTGQVWQATDCSANAALLRARDEPLPIVVTPADPLAFVEALRSRSPIEAQPAVTPRGVKGWEWVTVGALALGLGAVAAALAMFTAGPERMRYYVDNGELEVKTLFGRRRWSLRGISAHPHRVRLVLRLWGAGLPGYHTGLYLADGKRTRVYATQHEGVLLDGPVRIFVSPAEVEPFLAALEREGVTVRP
jgi:hypothetical protein